MKRNVAMAILATAQLTLAWGVAYKPSDEFSLRISPFATASPS